MANQISLDPKFMTHESVDLESWPALRLENTECFQIDGLHTCRDQFSGFGPMKQMVRG